MIGPFSHVQFIGPPPSSKTWAYPAIESFGLTLNAVYVVDERGLRPLQNSDGVIGLLGRPGRDRHYGAVYFRPVERPSAAFMRQIDTPAFEDA